MQKSFLFSLKIVKINYSFQTSVTNLTFSELLMPKIKKVEKKITLDQTVSKDTFKWINEMSVSPMF